MKPHDLEWELLTYSDAKALGFDSAQVLTIYRRAYELRTGPQHMSIADALRVAVSEESCDYNIQVRFEEHLRKLAHDHALDAAAVDDRDELASLPASTILVRATAALASAAERKTFLAHVEANPGDLVRLAARAIAARRLRSTPPPPPVSQRRPNEALEATSYAAIEAREIELAVDVDRAHVVRARCATPPRGVVPAGSKRCDEEV